MKQFTKIAVVCALAVSLAACGSSASSTAASSAASSEAASSVAASSEAASEAASSEAASVAEGEGYTGTQTASAKGMNGDVTVTITFENGVATACDVDASTETESLGQAAAPTVADAIVAGNTPNVDAVSGSTVTSNAIMEAARPAMTQPASLTDFSEICKKKACASQAPSGTLFPGPDRGFFVRIPAWKNACRNLQKSVDKSILPC